MPLKPRLAALLLLILPVTAHAAFDELLGKYATTDHGCESGATPKFEIRRGIVEGPNLLCILGAPKQAAAGEEAYEAKCTQGAKVNLGVLTFDLSAKPDHIRVSLPENKDWIALNPCK
ncbi:MAG: hypothetical protein WBW51_11640 [Methyloceanibacter sp.]